MNTASPMRLDEISDINLGFPFRGRIAEKSDGQVLAVQMKNVTMGQGVDWPACTRTALEGRREPDWLRSGDILLVARGSRNYAILVDASVANRQAVAAPHFYVIRCAQQQILPEFLTWQLNYGPCQRYFEREAEGTLTKSIRRTVLAQTPITVPALEKQRTIIRLTECLNKEQQFFRALLRNSDQFLTSLADELHRGGASVHAKKQQ